MEPGDDVIRGRILEKTRDQYGGKIKKLVSYLKSQHPTTIADNTIVLPLPVNAVKMFLQYTSIKRDKNGTPVVPAKFNSFAHINGHNSAIKYIYKEAKVTPSVELDSMMQGTLHLTTCDTYII